MNAFLLWATRSKTVTTPEPDAQSLTLRAWGGSNISYVQAEIAAATKLEALIAHAQKGGEHFFDATDYDYRSQDVREECLGGRLVEGKWVWVITRNVYGAEVLNTPNLAILDLDRQPRGFRAWFLGLFQSATQKNNRVRRRLEAWLAVTPEVALRLYETPNGFRAILTHAPYDPAGEALQALMKDLGVDPLYARLCARQQSFRARLTPKPWRMGMARAHWRPLAENEVRSGPQNQWLTAYQNGASRYAACRYLADLGAEPAVGDPVLHELIELHDRLSGALTDRPLA